MEDFTDFDTLYQLKTPFFLGLPLKAQAELNTSESDSEENQDQE